MCTEWNWKFFTQPVCMKIYFDQYPIKLQGMTDILQKILDLYLLKQQNDGTLKNITWIH